MEKLFLFFDTETTGLVDFNLELSEETVVQFPYLVELAWVLTNEKGRVLESESKIINPYGWGEKFKIENPEIHGIEEKTAKEFGFDMASILQNFQRVISREKMYGNKMVFVAHNLKFDLAILRANFWRIGRGLYLPESTICTMLESVEYCQIPNYKTGKGYKWPRLSELYVKLFGREFIDTHSALSDVMATKECFFGLREIGIIKT